MRPLLNGGTLGGRKKWTSMTSGWRTCPFIAGKQYRSLTTFSAFRDTFSAGELLTFVRTAYSPYDGMTGYFFSDSQGRLRAWDIHDDGDLAVHCTFFEKVVSE
jgi:hypothetical protein